MPVTDWENRDAAWTDVAKGSRSTSNETDRLMAFRLPKNGLRETPQPSSSQTLSEPDMNSLMD